MLCSLHSEHVKFIIIVFDDSAVIKNFFISLILFTSLTGGSHAADLILTNGKIYTLNDEQPWAESIVVNDGVIEWVGSNEQAQEYLHMETRLIDLQGKLVLPGFVDVHMHPLEAFESPQPICILEEGGGINRHLKQLKGCIENQKNENWFLGWGYWIDEIIDSSTMPKLLLDELVNDKPAVIFSLSSHSNWVNSATLDLMGWGAQTPNPTGGVIIKDEQTGEPTGIVLDNAADMINEHIYEPNDKALGSSYLGLIEAMDKIASYGITSIADARTFWTLKHHEIWQRVERAGKLKARTVLHLWAYPHLPDSQLETLSSLYQNDKDSLLKITGIKAYADGLIGNTTAALKKPYDVDYGILKGNRGLNYFDEQRLAKFITELEPEGFTFMIHTIGDRAVHESLNAIESAIRSNGLDIDRRHRLTHIDLIDDEDLTRFNELGVIADFQLASFWTHPIEYYPYARPFIKDRVENVYRIKNVFDTGAKVTLSSDFDVSSMNPIYGIQNSLIRGEQSLPSLHEAIKAYTLNAAYALGLDEITGSIEAGKYADLIVFDKNIFEMPENKISTARVLLTLLEGTTTYKDSGWAMP